MQEPQHKDTDLDSSLSNDSLAPTGEHQRTWKWYHIFNIWANDIQSLFGYTLAASLFIAYGVSITTAFLALIAAGLIVMFLLNIAGRPGVKYGIPYPVLSRASMGIGGAKLPSVLRTVVAVFWYGAQTYFASTALHLFLSAVTGMSRGKVFWGLTGLGWLSFFFVWGAQMAIFSYGMKWVSRFLNFAGPFVYIVMLGLLAVLWYQSGGQVLSSVTEGFSVAEFSFGNEFRGFIAIVGTMVAYFAAVMINFSDFSRYAKSKREMQWGNFIGLPINMLLFSALTLLITAGSHVVFGDQLTNPSEIVERADNTVLSVIAAITFFAATVGINLVANFIPAVNGIANLAPRELSFQKSGFLISIFALLIGGLWSSAISQIGISVFVNTMGAALAPLYGIMIVDYYFHRQEKLHIADLYSTDPSGSYYYQKGWNCTALFAFGTGAIFSIASVWLKSLGFLSGYAWLIGALLGGATYFFLKGTSKNSRGKEKGVLI